MKTRAITTRWLVVAVAVLLTGLVLSGAVLVQAQVGDGYDLTWNTVDGGGGTFSTGGGYSLGGTAGQPDAGVLGGGGYTLDGGFWAGAAAIPYRIYLPLVLRNG